MITATESEKLQKRHFASRMHASGGFSLVELIIAMLVLTVGLTGAAAMQLNALKGAFAASSQSTGGAEAQAWMEFFYGLISQREQTPMPSPAFDGEYVCNNFHRLSSLDLNPDDDQYTVLHPLCEGGTCGNCAAPDTGAPCIKLPSTIEDNKDSHGTITSTGLKTFFNDHHFTYAKSYSAFDDASMLPPIPSINSYMVWRIAANMPAKNVTTLQVSFLYKNAFVTNRGATLTLVLGTFQ